MYNFTIALQLTGFLEKTVENNEEIFHLTTPCRFRLDENIVKILPESYITDEEIGGIFWARPKTEYNEKIYTIKKISFIRNTIEDTPRSDHLNKSNAYLPEYKRLNELLDSIFTHGFLPIKFHTHPVKGSGFLQGITTIAMTPEKSDQDLFAGSFSHIFGKEKLLMPRCLIVGNDISSHDIFIGVYNGFVAPDSSLRYKKEMLEDSLQKTHELISAISFPDRQKTGFAIGAASLLAVIAKYPNYSLPVASALIATIPRLLTDTQNLLNLHYFNKLLSGCADIFIPEI
jgi:hypothetical protein